MADEVVVRCTAVARTYGRGTTAVVAVHGADCEVEPGANIALTGPSGSGKSTLLYLMGGLEDPTTGTVSWPALGGRSMLRPGPVGVIFQGPSLIPPLDVAENVALPLVLAGESDHTARHRALAALQRLGLDDLAAKLPEELSGGQAQRVAVARVLAGRPRLVLADEPTGQLDHISAAHVIDALVEACAEMGAALIVSTHDEQIASRLARRWYMDDGRLHTDRRQDIACSV